ncbi:hypothetical protein MG9_04904, partial [Candida albicans P37037]
NNNVTITVVGQASRTR